MALERTLLCGLTQDFWTILILLILLILLTIYLSIMQKDIIIIISNNIQLASYSHFQITGNLVKAKLRVPFKFIRVLPMNEACQVEGVEVTLLEANQ